MLLSEPMNARVRGGGGVAGVMLFYSRALLNVGVVPNYMDVSSFEFLEITFSFHLQNIRMAILYRPGHPGTDRGFMEEFSQFPEILSACREKLVVCGDFNYWLDNPSLKPYTGTNEFMSLLDINPFTPSPHNDIEPLHADPSRWRRKLGHCWGGMRCCRISAMLPYLDITHTESHCHVGLCLIKPDTLWKLLGLDVPNIMSGQVDGRKLTLGTSCQHERVNSMSNYVQVPMHISGHILDLVLTLVGVDLVNQIEVSPIDHRISDHALVTFELDVIGPTTYSKKIAFRSYQELNVREATSIIEDDLLSAVTEGLTSIQRVDSYNRGFTSLRDQFCPLVTKEIRVRDDAEWYDHRVVSLRRERRRAERRWRRICGRNFFIKYLKCYIWKFLYFLFYF